MKKIAQFVISLLLLITGASSSYAQITLKSEAKSLLGIEVHFRFDKSQLDLDYMGNRDALARFTHVIDSIGLLKIDSIVVVSQSSPEGPYEYNTRLSQRRAATMRRAIEHRHPELKELLRVHPDGESWERLREYVVKDTKMKQSTIEKVLNVIDADINIGTKKWRMEKLPVYRYLYQTYYPRIRNSVFCIVYYDLHTIPTQIEELISPTSPSISDEKIEPVPLVRPIEREPVLNVRTNLLYDLGTVLNVGIEYYPRNPRWSVAGHYTFPWWDIDHKHLYLQLLDWNLEARYYLQRGKQHAGWYAAPYVHWNLYDISFDAKNGWQGEGRGCGVGIGYVWHIGDSHRWKMECFARFGYYHTLFDPYHAGDPYKGKYYYDWPWAPEDFTPRNHRLQWIGPMGAGVTVSYDLFRRKLKIKN